MNRFNVCRAVLSGFVGLLLAAAATQAQNPVADWDANSLTAILTAKKSPVVSFVYFTYVDVAMFDAVNSIDRRFKPFAVCVDAPNGSSQDAAVIAAAHDVLVHYFPNQQAALDAQEVASFAAIPDGQPKIDGMAVGQTVAAHWIALRANDGLEAPVVYTPGHGPGIWEPVPTFPAPPPNTPPPPAAPWLAQFRPFALTSADQFLSEVEPPFALTSEEWSRDFNYTKKYGAFNSSYRTSKQTEIGMFWADHGGAQISRAFRNLIATQQLSTADAARLGAMSNVVVADSLAACFNAKYHFAFWRPYTAIHNADTDSNPDTSPDPNWIPLDVTPGHPEYPAAHGCGTQALMDTLTRFFETDEVPYVVSSNVTGTTHDFTSFEDVVREVDAARIYGGMHFRHAVKQGNVLGRKVADYILDNYFLPVEER